MVYTCDVCGETYADELLYTIHWELYHNITTNMDEDTGPTSRPSVIHYAPPSEVQVEDRPLPTLPHPQDPTEPLEDQPMDLEEEEPTLDIEILSQALQNSVVRHYRIKNTIGFDISSFLSKSKPLVLETLQKELRRLNVIKFGLVLDTTFTNMENEISNRGFISRNRSLVQDDDIDAVVEECLQEIILKLTEHEARGSGWSLLTVTSMDIRVHKRGYGERGSSYIPLPKKIQNTKSCINVKNEDNECFRYAMLSKFLLDEPHPEKPDRYYEEVTHRYNFRGVSYPVAVSDIRKFERLNPGVSVNVYALDERSNVYPLKIASRELRDHTDLLLLKKGPVSHYVYIKDFSRLISRQLTKRHCPITVCKRCFSFKYLAENRGGSIWLREHTRLCGEKNPVQIKLPKQERSVLRFFKTNHQYRIPIVVYADFEASLLPVEEDPESPYRNAYQRHEPNSYCLLVKSSISDELLHLYGINTSPRLYRGENAAERFVDELYDLANRVSTFYSHITPMHDLTNLQMLSHLMADECYLCGKHFTDDNIKVHDHDHLTGEYRGPACNACNINYKLPNFIPVVFHNLSGYDSHMIIPHLGRDDGRIEVLASTSERFISFSKTIGRIKLRFVDSFRFMPSSLLTLSKNLDLKDLIETQKLVPRDKIELVLRKGVFPYDYVDSFEKFNETSLPSREAFYNTLDDTEISELDYDHACKVWRELQINTLGEYSDFYVTLDVTILCDVMEEFRNTCIAAYGLDPFHSYTCPGLAWQSMLKETKCQIQLLTDIDMVLMVESGVRGGLTQSITRYVKANNKYLPDYDPTKESVYIGYFDANNLYGWAMSMPLPISDFQWVDSVTIEDICAIPKHGNTGYILEFDFEYPHSLHDHHYDLPLLPRSEVPPNGKHKKLMTTLKNKERYVAHYWIVQQAIELGIRITKIHRVLRFHQTPWLKPYIDLNTERRKAAKSKFHQDFFKLMNNAIFGKTLENKRNHMNLKLVTNAKQLQKLVQKPNFNTSIIINGNLVAVCMDKTCVTMDRPLYVGMSVLDISKTHMYDFHYNKMVHFYGRDRIGISYMDTDAYVYWIKTPDMYEDLRTFCHKNDFDFSDYPIDHPSYDNGVNKKVLGKFKDEANGVPPVEIVALMSKMYTIKMMSDRSGNIQNTIIKKAKGIKKAFLQKELQFNQYYDCLFRDKTYHATFNSIRSYNHQLFSVRVSKVSLTSKDDKRKIMEDNIHTLPYGHYLLQD